MIKQFNCDFFSNLVNMFETFTKHRSKFYYYFRKNEKNGINKF